MITMNLNVFCDQCDEPGTSTVLVDPILVALPLEKTKVVKRVLTLSYQEEIRPKGWIQVEIQSTIKLYCTACKEKMANEIDD